MSGYRRHLVSATAPGPLSREEIEREEVKQAQNDAAVGVDSRHQTMTGILFPMDDAAGKAAQDIRHKRTDYVRLSIDIKNEVIVLEEKGEMLEKSRIAGLRIINDLSLQENALHRSWPTRFRPTSRAITCSSSVTRMRETLESAQVRQLLNVSVMFQRTC